MTKTVILCSKKDADHHHMCRFHTKTLYEEPILVGLQYTSWDWTTIPTSSNQSATTSSGWCKTVASSMASWPSCATIVVMVRQRVYEKSQHHTKVRLAMAPHFPKQFQAFWRWPRRVAVAWVPRHHCSHRPFRRYLLRSLGRRPHQNHRPYSVDTEEPHTAYQGHREQTRKTSENLVAACVTINLL